MTYRNSWYHRFLDRHRAAERLAAWGRSLEKKNPIPAHLPASTGDGLATNVAEKALQVMLREAGLGEPKAQVSIPLGPGKFTYPDFFYPKDMKGLCVYMDGMSFHGDPQTKSRDAHLTGLLEQQGYEVLRIPSVDLWDHGAMAKHLARAGLYLVGAKRAKRIVDGGAWYGAGREELPSRREEDAALGCHERRTRAAKEGQAWNPWRALDEALPNNQGEGVAAEDGPPDAAAADGPSGASPKAGARPERAPAAAGSGGRDGSSTVGSVTADVAAASGAAASWDECLALLDEDWRSLAEGLRDAGLPPPADVHADILEGGRVTRRAVFEWRRGGDILARVVPESAGRGAKREVPARPDSDAGRVADALRHLLESTAP
jgi:very-short-patch-repair endonuclease